MKILILGHGRHGKDTVAELLHKLAGLQFMSSSWACAEVLKPALDCVLGYERSLDSHYLERHNNRELWKRLISLYTAADPSALARLIVSKCDVYVGMRSQREFDASRHLFDLILWVDASLRVDYEDPTMEIKYEPALMIPVRNHGTLEELEATVRDLAVSIGRTV